VFLQVFRARVAEPGPVHESHDRWAGALQGDPGWLGTTAGVTDDGEAFTLARFASADAARSPARDAWWSEMSALSTEPVNCQDCGEVITQLHGDSPDAGFVQVLQGRVADLERLEHALEIASPWEADARTDIIGGLLALHGDGHFTQAVYFTSEAAAREGEARATPPPETGEIDALVSELAFYDLRNPWAYAPR
jgi:hypothetical protein